jgi:hypothetical protein
MAFRLRTDIQKRQVIFRFGYFVAGNFSVDDAGENA